MGKDYFTDVHQYVPAEQSLGVAGQACARALTTGGPRFSRALCLAHGHDLPLGCGFCWDHIPLLGPIPRQLSRRPFSWV